ncbi:plasmid partition protein ParG, partial [Escherichia coli]
SKLTPMILERRPRIHIRFKAASTKQGTSITDVIKDLVDNWLKENDSQKTQMSKNTLTQKHTYPYREH